MNIRKNTLLLFLLFMVLPTIVRADDYSYNMQIKENPNYLNEDDEITLQATVNSAADDLYITGGSFTIRYDASIFDIVSFDGKCTGVKCNGLYNTNNSDFKDIKITSFDSDLDKQKNEQKITTTFKIPTLNNKSLNTNKSYVILDYTLRVKKGAKKGQTVIYSVNQEDKLSCIYEKKSNNECMHNYNNIINVGIKEPAIDEANGNNDLQSIAITKDTNYTTTIIISSSIALIILVLVVHKVIRKKNKLW